MCNDNFADITEKEGTKSIERDNVSSSRDFAASGLDINAIREKVGISQNSKDGQSQEQIHTSHDFVQTGTDIRTIRDKIGLSQREFAALLCISKRTLEGWEQGHRTLNGPARALLTIFKNDPEGAIKALHGNK